MAIYHYFCSLLMHKIRIIIAFLAVLAVLQGCNKTPKPISREALIHQMDSITNARINELYQQAQVDLERRIPIEVKPKADSIVNARLALKQKAAATQPNTKQPGNAPGQ